MQNNGRPKGSRDTYQRSRTNKHPFVTPEGFCTAREAAKLLGKSEVWFHVGLKHKLAFYVFGPWKLYKIADVEALKTSTKP